MSHSIQPVLFAQGRMRKVDGSATIRKSPPPCISAIAKPPPGVNTGKTVRCAVSLASSVVVMVTPARIALDASDASNVLPRSTPCWSANEKRTTSSFSFLMIFSTSAAALACAPVHKPWRSTKLEGLRGRGFIAGLAEVCRRDILNRAQRLAGPLVVHFNVGTHSGVGLVLLLMRNEAVIVVLVLVRDVIGQLVELEPLAAHLVFVDRRAEAREDRIPIVLLVIDRHVPLRDRHFPAHRKDEGIGKHQIGHANV